MQKGEKASPYLILGLASLNRRTHHSLPRCRQTKNLRLRRSLAYITCIASVLLPLPLVRECRLNFPGMIFRLPDEMCMDKLWRTSRHGTDQGFCSDPFVTLLSA